MSEDLFSPVMYRINKYGFGDEVWEEMKQWVNAYGDYDSWAHNYSLFISVPDWTFFKLKFADELCKNRPADRAD